MYILLIIIAIAIAFCIWGLTLSLKEHKKTKNLQKSADYIYETRNGAYSFVYTIKGFKTEQGKIIKIIVQPVLGFSDLTTSATNSFKDATVNCTDITTNQSCEGIDMPFPEISGLNATMTLKVPQQYVDINGAINIQLKIVSYWNLGEYDITESLTFNYNK